MGRQVGIYASEKDVEELPAFLGETTEIAVSVGFASDREKLWVAPPKTPEDFVFHVWNKRFPWTPTVGKLVRSRTIREWMARTTSPTPGQRQLSRSFAATCPRISPGESIG